MAVFDVATVADHLGVDETEVCRRITDGRLRSMRDLEGRLCVFLDAAAIEVTGRGADNAPGVATDAQIIEKLQTKIARIEGVCTALREEVQRLCRLRPEIGDQRDRQN